MTTSINDDRVSSKRETGIKHVDNFRRFAYGLIFAMLGLFGATAAFSDKFSSLVSLDGDALSIAVSVSKLMLILAWILLVILWISATAHEFHIWQDHLDWTLIRSQTFIAIGILAAALGIAPVLVVYYDLRFFNAYYAIFLFGNYWGQSVTNQHFAKALASTRSANKSRGLNDPALEVLEGYWLGRPQLGRIVVMLAVAWIAFGLAMASGYPSGPGRLLSLLAAGILFLDILAGEMVIGWWRKVRDDKRERLEQAPGSQPVSTTGRAGE